MQGRGREKEVHLISGDLRGSVYMDMMWPWRFDQSAWILTQEKQARFEEAGFERLNLDGHGKGDQVQLDLG